MHTNNGPLHVLSYRLRSARNKKRSQKEDFEKRLIQLHKQRVALWTKQGQLPWIPLAEPYQKGWKRFFVLREDVRRSKNAEFYQTLLDKINTVHFSKDKTYKVKKRRRRRNVYEVKKQSLREFSEWDWNNPKLKLTEKEKMFFYRRETWCPQRKSIMIQYVYSEPWRFVLKVKPHMITEIRMIDAELEQQIQRLKNHIEKNHLGHKINKMTNGRRQSRKWSDGVKLKDQHPFKNKPLQAILDECRKENIINHQP